MEGVAHALMRLEEHADDDIEDNVVVKVDIRCTHDESDLMRGDCVCTLMSALPMAKCSTHTHLSTKCVDKTQNQKH